jgi:DNA invertase Pin-like site-specific DNA recombinase
MGRKKEATVPRRAYSYLRVSSGKQAGRPGRENETAATGLERQWQYAVERAEREGWFLDESLTFVDAGVSGYHKENLGPTGDLFRFLRLMSEGRILPGEVLIIENIDRLTRAEVRTAYRLWCEILDGGVWIATEIPEKLYTPDQTDLSDILDPILSMVANHADSAKKADRMRKNWIKIRELAKDKRPHGRKTPTWILRTSRGYELDPIKQAVILRFVDLAMSGMGTTRIARHANANPHEFPVFGRSSRWTEGNILYILTSPALKGEYQPQAGRPKQPIGSPIAGYYPAVLEEAKWRALQACIRHRTHRYGRVSPRIHNLFTGLVYCGEHPAQLAGGDGKGTGRRNYFRGKLSGGRMVHIPYKEAETAILHCLGMLSPADLLPPGAERSELDERIKTLNGDLTAIALRIEEHQRLQSDPKCRIPVAELAERIAELRDHETSVKAELEPLRWERQNPAADALGGVQTLVSMLEEAAERGEDVRELRSRLRGAIPSVVSRINLVGERLSLRRVYAHIMVHFRSGEPRHIGVEPRRGIPPGEVFTDLSDTSHPAWAVGDYARDPAPA